MGVLTAEMQRVVLEQRLAYHATVCADGTANLSPKGTTTVYDDDHLMFADIRSPRTIENLLRNPSIEVNVLDVFARRGYRFKGTATIHVDDDVHRRGLEILRERDYGDFEERFRAIVLIRVERAEALTSPSYDVGETEAELVERYAGYYASLYPQLAQPRERESP